MLDIFSVHFIWFYTVSQRSAVMCHYNYLEYRGNIVPFCINLSISWTSGIIIGIVIFISFVYFLGLYNQGESFDLLFYALIYFPVSIISEWSVNCPNNGLCWRFLALANLENMSCEPFKH